MTKQNLKERVNFEIIRYANCWEDAEVLLRGLSPAPGSKILSVGSAGDNSFSLLITNPELVLAIDINKIQLFLIELKRVCIKNFEREETLAFLGFTPSETREKLFHSIKSQLGAEARAYWESNLKLIKNGVIHEGKFEKYFKLFSAKILPWIHSKSTVEKLLAAKTQLEQEDFYQNKWNTWRWRLLFRIFFSRYVMGKYGRDPEFLKQVDGSVSQFIFKKASQHLSSASAQENFILHYNLTGYFGGFLPHYLQKGNYETIRNHINQLHLKEGFVQSAGAEYGKFDCMNLSDIFEYMDSALFRKTAGLLVEMTQKGGKIAYWNLMVPRRMSAVLRGYLDYCKEESESLTAIDKGFFYNQFILERVSK